MNIERLEQTALKKAKETKRGRHMKRKICQIPILQPLYYAFWYLIAVPVLVIVHTLVFGLVVRGRKNLRGLYRKGFVTISNHIHYLDSSMIGQGVFPKKVLYTAMPAQFKIPIVRVLITILGCVPTPSGTSDFEPFFYFLSKRVAGGRCVHFFPEGEMTMFGTEIKDFKKGAFMIACLANSPIVPICYTYRPRLFKKCRPKVTQNIGKPIYPDVNLDFSERVMKLLNQSKEAMEVLKMTD